MLTHSLILDARKLSDADEAFGYDGGRDLHSSVSFAFFTGFSGLPTRRAVESSFLLLVGKKIHRRVDRYWLIFPVAHLDSDFKFSRSSTSRPGNGWKIYGVRDGIVVRGTYSTSVHRVVFRERIPPDRFPYSRIRKSPRRDAVGVGPSSRSDEACEFRFFATVSVESKAFFEGLNRTCSIGGRVLDRFFKGFIGSPREECDRPESLASVRFLRGPDLDTEMEKKGPL